MKEPAINLRDLLKYMVCPFCLKRMSEASSGKNFIMLYCEEDDLEIQARFRKTPKTPKQKRTIVTVPPHPLDPFGPYDREDYEE